MKSILSALVFTLSIAAFSQLSYADQKDVADARKNVADAQTAVNKAQLTYDKAKDAVKAQLAKTPEYAAASKDLATAKIDLDKSTKPVVDKVHASPEYIAAKKSFDENDAKMKALQIEIRGGASKAGDLADATVARGNAKQKMDQLENEAIASDPKIQSARKSMTDSQHKIDELNGSKLQPMIDADKPCTDAKKTLDDAQTALTEAKTALDAAIKQAKEDAKSHGGGAGHKGGGHGMGGGK